MITREQLQEIEKVVGFRYPASFASMFAEFASLLGNEGFRRVFPDAQLLLSAPEIAAVRESMPLELLPFMRVEQPTWPDIYAFDLENDAQELRVVVWSDHAIVADWESFPDFFQWVRELVAKNDTASR